MNLRSYINAPSAVCQEAFEKYILTGRRTFDRLDGARAGSDEKCGVGAADGAYYNIQLVVDKGTKQNLVTNY